MNKRIIEQSDLHIRLRSLVPIQKKKDRKNFEMSYSINHNRLFKKKNFNPSKMYQRPNLSKHKYQHHVSVNKNKRMTSHACNGNNGQKKRKFLDQRLIEEKPKNDALVFKDNTKFNEDTIRSRVLKDSKSKTVTNSKNNGQIGTQTFERQNSMMTNRSKTHEITVRSTNITKMNNDRSLTGGPRGVSHQKSAHADLFSDLDKKKHEKCTVQDRSKESRIPLKTTISSEPLLFGAEVSDWFFGFGDFSVF